MKKKTAITAGAAAALAAALIGVFTPGTGTKDVTYHYEITDNGNYTASIVLDVPDDEYHCDMAELFAGGESVDITLLPGSITSLPVLFSDPSALSVKLYRQGAVAGVGVLDDGGRLICTMQEVDDNAE